MMIDKKQKTLKKKSPKKILPNGVPKKETLPTILKIIPKKEENFPKKGIVFPKKKFQKNLSKNNKSILPNEIQINK